MGEPVWVAFLKKKWRDQSPKHRRKSYECKETKCHLWANETASRRTNPTDILIIDFQPSKLGEHARLELPVCYDVIAAPARQKTIVWYASGEESSTISSWEVRCPHVGNYVSLVPWLISGLALGWSFNTAQLVVGWPQELQIWTTPLPVPQMARAAILCI